MGGGRVGAGVWVQVCSRERTVQRTRDGVAAGSGEPLGAWEPGNLGAWKLGSLGAWELGRGHGVSLHSSCMVIAAWPVRADGRRGTGQEKRKTRRIEGVRSRLFCLVGRPTLF